LYFDFSDEQYALRDAARDFFAGECSPTHLRSAWDSETGRSPELWAKMAETGFVGLTVPEEHGGLGMDEVDLVLILEEAGRAALPEPLLENTAVGVPLLCEAGTETQQREWLPRIAAGDAVITVQLAEPARPPQGRQRGEVLRVRRRAQGQLRVPAVPRRHRLHVGARPAPVAQARQGARAGLRISP
jgi:alkylation response protein AidB-like acyl-CoA dehydrogenase